MELKQQHLILRIKVSFVIQIFALLFIIVREGISIYAYKSEADCYLYIIQFIVALLITISIVITYILRKDSLTFKRVSLIGSTVVYAVLMILNDNYAMYTFAVPIFFSAIIYLDKRYLIGGSINVSILNIIFICKKVLGGQITKLDDFSQVGAQLTVIVITVISVNSIGNLLTRFNEEEKEVLRSKAAEQKLVSDKIIVIAEKLNNYLNNSTENISSLNSSAKSNNDMMNNIVSKSQENIKSIKNQTNLSKIIECDVKETSNSVIEIIDSSNKSKKIINEGSELVQKLQNQSENVQQASEITRNSSNELLSRIGKMQNIIGSILEISNKTNLLALNASIEAA